MWKASTSHRATFKAAAKQLEGAAARGSKGTEVLKGPGGSLGSVRRNCVQAGKATAIGKRKRSATGKAAVKGWKSRGIALWKASTSHQATFKSAAKQLEGSCGEGFEGYGRFGGARRQSRKRKKELCVHKASTGGKATGDPPG